MIHTVCKGYHLFYSNGDNRHKINSFLQLMTNVIDLVQDVPEKLKGVFLLH